MGYDKVSLVRKHFHSCSDTIFVVKKRFFVTLNSSRAVDTCPDPKQSIRNFLWGLILGVNMFPYLIKEISMVSKRDDYYYNGELRFVVPESCSGGLLFEI